MWWSWWRVGGGRGGGVTVSRSQVSLAIAVVVVATVTTTLYAVTQFNSTAPTWCAQGGRETSRMFPPMKFPHPGSLHVLVTGGAGYIGSHAALLLLERGYAVTVLDNLSRGNLGAIGELQRVAQQDQLRFVELDLGNGEEVLRLFVSSKFDVVIHFAAIAYVGESVKFPDLYYLNVTANTLNVLEAMTLSGCTNLIYSSSCATYGNAERMPIVEGTPQVPTSPYGASKLMAEQMIKDHARAHPSFSAVLLRYFNVVGADVKGRLGEAPHRDVSVKYGRISAACFDAALGHRPDISVYGKEFKTPDGTCVRDYVHVWDLVRAHVLAMERMKHERVKEYNVGTGTGYSVSQFVSACRKVTGVDIKVVHKPARPGDAAAVYANSSKIQQELKWKPVHTKLDDMLRTSWAWTKRHPTGY